MKVLSIILSLIFVSGLNSTGVFAQDPCVNGSMTITYDTADYNNGPSTLLETQYNAAYTYQWYSNGAPITGATSYQYTANNVGVYYVEVTGNSCVTMTNSVTIYNAPNLTVSVLAPATTICIGDTLELAAITNTSTGNSFEWYNQVGILLGTDSTLNVSTSGAYYAKVSHTDGNGMVAQEYSDTVSIFVNIAMNPSITTTSTYTCDGVSATLETSTCVGCNYEWYELNNGISTLIPTSLNDTFHTVFSAGSFYVETQYPNGCKASSATIAIQDANFTVDLRATDSVLYCNNDSVLLIATSFSNTIYTWFDGNVPIKAGMVDDSTLWVDNTFILSLLVQAIQPNGCLAQSNIATIQDSTGTLSLDIEPKGVCKIAPDSLYAIASGGSGNYFYHWMSGFQGDKTAIRGASYSNSGIAWNVTVTDLNTGCQVIDTFEMATIPIDTLDYILAPDSIVDFCLVLPSGTTNNVISSTHNFGYGVFTANTIDCYTYQAGTSTEVVERFMIVLEDTINNTCRENLGSIRHASCVWAGDANDDQIVNNVDVLYLGMGYGNTGFIRPNAGIDYDCEPSQNWNVGIGNPVVDLKHSDTDGSGLIDDNDTMAIAQNWGLLHLRGQRSAGQVIIELDTATANLGDEVDLAVLMHDSILNTVSGAYGLAFTINYDNDFVDTNSVYVDFSNSWMGTIGTNMIGMYKDFYYNNKTEVAITRTNHQNVSGMGEVARMYFTIKDDVILRGGSPKLNLIISNITFIDSAGLPIGVSPRPSQVLVVNPILNVSETTEVLENEVGVYPNPSNGQFRIKSNNPIEQIEVFNTLGQVVEHKIVNKVEQLEMNLGAINTGVYWMLIKTSIGVSKQKILIK